MGFLLFHGTALKMLSPKTCPHYLQHQMQLGNAAGLPTDPDSKTTKKIESSLLAKCREFQLMFTKIKAHIEQAGTAFIDYYSLCLQGSTELRKRLLSAILLALRALCELLLSSSKSLTLAIMWLYVRQMIDKLSLSPCFSRHHKVFFLPLARRV